MFNALNRTRKRAELSRNAMSEIQNVQQSEIQNVQQSEIQNVQQSEIQNVHKPKPSDVCDKCTLAAEYRPQQRRITRPIR